MSTKLPLPLELTKPVLLASDLNTQVRTDSALDYDPTLQLCGGGGDCGGRKSGGHGNTSCNNHSKTGGIGLLNDVVGDIQVDDLVNF